MTFAREILEPRSKTEGRRRNENPFDGANTPSHQRVTCPAFEVQKGTRLALPGPPNASIHPDPSRHGPRLRLGPARPGPGRRCWPRPRAGHFPQFRLFPRATSSRGAPRVKLRLMSRAQPAPEQETLGPTHGLERRERGVRRMRAGRVTTGGPGNALRVPTQAARCKILLEKLNFRRGVGWR